MLCLVGILPSVFHHLRKSHRTAGTSLEAFVLPLLHLVFVTVTFTAVSHIGASI